MERKVIITRDQDRIITTLFEDGKAAELNLYSERQASILGNIYIGRVKNIAKHIGAAFIEIEKGLPCYYPLNDCDSPIFTKKINSKELVAGDELLVQVCREASKSKPPTVTSNLNFTGKYMVLTTGKKQVGISAKINGVLREELKELISAKRKQEYGFIVRTNAKDATKEELFNEMKTLTNQCDKLIEHAKFLNCFSVISKEQEAWLTVLRDTNRNGLNAIIAEDDELYETMKQHLEKDYPEDLKYLKHYQDDLLPLAKFYNIAGELEAALKERVWLKSGAYLVIQPTEALTVIDVNTGKYESKKKKQDTFLKINTEAAEEIARQLRLRNISGIVIVDFINMESEEAKQQLLAKLDICLKKDPVKAVLIGMTPLNLVELTRQKKKKPLAEQIR